MKRCPQCDFLYEDDQGLCDMDGSALECVREVSPRAHAAATRPTRAPGRRRLPALLIAGTIFGAILPASYYVTTSQTAAVHTGPAPVEAAEAAAATAAARRPESTPVIEATAPAPEPPPEPPAAKVRPAAAPSRKKVGAAVRGGVPVRKPPPRSAERQAGSPRPESTSRKKESKLGAVLKKTGRILKKPFGF